MPITRRDQILSLSLGLLAFATPTPSASAKEAPGIVRAFSGSIRQLESRLDAIRSELATLPNIPSGPKGGSLGFHSNTRHISDASSDPTDVTIDLGREREIDSIILIPATIVFGSGDSRSYGFPSRFKVEISNSADFASSHLVAGEDDSRGANPFPAVIIDAAHTTGRYVRVTATELWRSEESQRSLFALGELMVFSGGRNIAPGRAVTASESDTIEAKPLWSTGNLVDGQSSLGHPTTDERSPTNGYHSEIESRAENEKWVQVDLGEPMLIDEVRVLPARPIDWAESHGFGFPERFRIEASSGEEFSNPITLADHSAEPFANPGDNPVVVPLDGVEARFVRLTTTQLWQREGDFVFALAEMQVFCAGENVALGAPVSASDSLTQGFWSTRFLVDGFDSQQRIDNDELGWLRDIVRKQELGAEQAAIELRLLDEISTVTDRLVWISSAGGTGLVACACLLFVRARVLRRRETDRLRERIASDLHDEIGSNLGSIALLSQIGSKPEDFAQINRVARETAASMQDIAWVIRGGHDRLEDLPARMREVAAAMLKDIDYTFTVSPDAIPERRVSLDFRRNTLLFFKEALHNLTRHSGATKAAIQIEFGDGRCRLQIGDNGCGFDPNSLVSHSGTGLKNMRKRAAALGGEVSITSSPGAETLVELRAPY